MHSSDSESFGDCRRRRLQGFLPLGTASRHVELVQTFYSPVSMKLKTVYASVSLLLCLQVRSNCPTKTDVVGGTRKELRGSERNRLYRAVRQVFENMYPASVQLRQ
jgi:hypothetical protein